MASSRRTPEEVRQIIADKIPEGIVKAEHTADAHYYRHIPTGILLPSVTTITGILGGGEHLKKWAAQLCADHIEEHIEIFLRADLLGRQEIYRAGVLAHKDTLEDAGGIGTEGHGVAESYIKKWLETGTRPAEIVDHITGEDYRLWAIARSAQQFFHDYYAIPVASELKVAHVWGRKNKEGYAGTLDALMYLAFPETPAPTQLPGMTAHEHDLYMNPSQWDRFTCIGCGMRWRYYLTLVDFKTSNSIWKFPTPEGKVKELKDDYVQQVSAYWKALKWMAGIACQKTVIVRLDKAQKKYEIGEVYDIAGAYKAFLGLKKSFDWYAAPHQKSATLAAKERVSVIDL